jgi:hypothetical protein
LDFYRDILSISTAQLVIWTQKQQTLGTETNRKSRLRVMGINVIMEHGKNKTRTL